MSRRSRHQLTVSQAANLAQWASPNETSPLFAAGTDWIWRNTQKHCKFATPQHRRVTIPLRNQRIGIRLCRASLCYFAPTLMRPEPLIFEFGAILKPISTNPIPLRDNREGISQLCQGIPCAIKLWCIVCTPVLFWKTQA